MTDLLLVVGLAVVGLQACAAAGAVLYSRSRPRRMMRWAVRRRAEMSHLGSIMFLAVRRGQRTFRGLSIILEDELRPALGQLGKRVELFGELVDAIEGAEGEAQP